METTVTSFRHNRVAWIMISTLALAAAGLLSYWRGEATLRTSEARAIALGVPFRSERADLRDSLPATDCAMAAVLRAEGARIAAWFRLRQTKWRVAGEPIPDSLPFASIREFVHRGGEPSIKEQDAMRGFLQDNAVPIERISQACDLDPGVYAYDVSAPASEAFLPHIAIHRFAARALGIQVVDRAVQRDGDAVQGLLRDLVHMNWLLVRGSHLHERVASMSIDRDTLDLFIYVLNADMGSDLDVGFLNDLVDVVKERHTVRPVVSTYIRHYYDTLTLLSGRSAQSQSESTLPWHYSVLPGLTARDLAAALDGLVDLSKGANLSPRQALAWYRQHESAPRSFSRFRQLSEFGSWVTVSESLDVLVELNQQHELISAAIAVRGFRLKKGVWPIELRVVESGVSWADELHYSCSGDEDTAHLWLDSCQGVRLSVVLGAGGGEP